LIKNFYFHLVYFSFSFLKSSSSYFHKNANSPFTTALSNTLNVQQGTKNNKAGYGWLKKIIAWNVKTIPIAYPIKHHVKYEDFTLIDGSAAPFPS